MRIISKSIKVKKKIKKVLLKKNTRKINKWKKIINNLKIWKHIYKTIILLLKNRKLKIN